MQWAKARHVQSLFKLKPKKPLPTNLTGDPGSNPAQHQHHGRSTTPTPRHTGQHQHHHQAPSTGHGSVLGDAAGSDAAAQIPVMFLHGYGGPGPRSFFAGSSNFHLEKFNYQDSSRSVQAGSYVDASYNVTYDYPGSGASKGWDALVQNTAPRALLESQGIDAPKCEPGTRADVLSDIMSFIHSPSTSQRMLVITGPVGSGKSALQHTTAEACQSQGTLAASFFFSSQDRTRDSAARLVPTIAYQLAMGDPLLRMYITQSVDRDPLVFKKGIRAQVEGLVVGPMRMALAHRAADGNVGTFPHVIVVDGLDECKGEREQKEVLEALHYLVASDIPGFPTPFRVVVTSRPEYEVWSSLEDAGGRFAGDELVRHIKLADDYDATSDIRRFFHQKLADIARRSHDPRCSRGAVWPREEDVETLVQNASGQFIYAVVVLNYISERRSSPVDRLSNVLSWATLSPPGSPPQSHYLPTRLVGRGTRRQGSMQHPLSALDVLYTKILGAAREAYEEVDHEVEDLVILLRLHQFNMDGRLGDGILALPLFEAFLGLAEGTTHSLISDVRSLLTIREWLPPVGSSGDSGVGLSSPLTGAGRGGDWDSLGNDSLHFYHKSLLDFLDDSSRAGEMYVSPAEVAAQLVICALGRVGEALDFDLEVIIDRSLAPGGTKQPEEYNQVLDYSLSILQAALPMVETLTPEFFEALYHFTEVGGWEKLDKYVRGTHRHGRFGKGLQSLFEVYQLHMSKDVSEDPAAAKQAMGCCFQGLSEGEIFRVMEIVDEYRGRWLRDST